MDRLKNYYNAFVWKAILTQITGFLSGISTNTSSANTSIRTLTNTPTSHLISNTQIPAAGTNTVYFKTTKDVYPQVNFNVNNSGTGTVTVQIKVRKLTDLTTPTSLAVLNGDTTLASTVVTAYSAGTAVGSTDLITTANYVYTSTTQSKANADVINTAKKLKLTTTSGTNHYAIDIITTGTNFTLDRTISFVEAV